MTVFADDELRRIREQLPAIQRIAYLNAGTLGPLPERAIDAMAIERERDEQVRQAPDHWDCLVAAQQRARVALGALTGTSPDHVALMHATHPGLNACLWGMELADGDAIVTTDEEHPGLLVPLRHLHARRGCDVRFASWRSDDEEFVAAILALVDARTRAVALSHVSWTSGRIAPLRMVRDALPDHVRLIVDGAQSAGVLAIDPADGWDAYTVSGQKWPCGPNGTGGVALADPTAWQPTFGAYMQVRDHADVVHSELVDDGRRLEFAQESITPLAGFAASVAWLTQDVGLARAHAHARSLNERVRAQLRDGGVRGDRLHGFDHLLSIDAPGENAVAAVETMLARGILVRWLSPTRLRASFGCWNTPEEADQLAESIVELIA